MKHNKFDNLTDLEVYVLKRALIEASYQFNKMDSYQYDKQFRLCADKLLNELGKTDTERLNNIAIPF